MQAPCTGGSQSRDGRQPKSDSNFAERERVLAVVQCRRERVKVTEERSPSEIYILFGRSISQFLRPCKEKYGNMLYNFSVVPQKHRSAEVDCSDSYTTIDTWSYCLVLFGQFRRKAKRVPARCPCQQVFSICCFLRLALFACTQ